MKKKFLLSSTKKWQSSKLFKSLFVFGFFCMLALNGFAHRVEVYTFGCVQPGNTMSIDGIIVDGNASTWYNWQYKDASGVWKCFVNGVNLINGVGFTVSGASAQNIANDAPTLMINGANSSLEDVQVRVIMADGVDPCNPGGGIVYGDDSGTEAKHLRLHVYSDVSICPPFAYVCPGNTLFNGTGYYGGFENKFYVGPVGIYNSLNFGAGIASSDLPFGVGSGFYNDNNNPHAVIFGFGSFAPHTGNFQLVVQGSGTLSDRAWYKPAVSVVAGQTYQFAAYAARVDESDPIVNLKVNGVTIQTADLSVRAVGQWIRISGQYSATAADAISGIVISITDSRAGGFNNYSLDDICFQPCNVCITLPLHNLDLSASLSGNTVALKWTAENELNTHQFVIERSSDGRSFIQVGMTAASGQTNTLTEYKSSDDIQSAVSANLFYYRVKAIDIDGRFTYSNVVTVRLTKTAGILVWPNPFDNKISITYNSAANTKVEVSILNSAGKVIRNGNYSVSRGSNQISVDNLGELSSGFYMLRVTDLNSNESFVHKLTK